MEIDKDLEDEVLYPVLAEFLEAGRFSLPIFITVCCANSLAFGFYCATADGDNIALSLVGRGVQEGFTHPFYVTITDFSGIVGQAIFREGEPTHRIMPPPRE